MSREGPRDQAGESRICRACGLCCDALLHRHADVLPEERAAVEAAGLAVYIHGSGFAFHLPCPKLHGTECSIYADRPPACQTFRCRLLRWFDAEEITLENALSIVERARELWRAVTEELGASRAVAIWTAVARHTEALGESAPSPTFGLHTVALLTLIRRRFAADDFEPYR